MTNEEKAKEFKVNDVCCVWNGGCPNVYNAAMEMAEWKEKQFSIEQKQLIENALEFIAEWFYTHPHTKGVFSDEFENVDDLLKRIKIAMEE